ncbi:interferon gamma receptor 1 isoform X3 [Xiphias gladius]|uniref:interferon gamma receptor 1 isoform X3 n=1 Tax=Xiphias gladius TaxID=8245 RepID=UPI001A993055|nr:interferon gamma receptor 1 isoform X3 [Xiphias gladius]
MLVPPPTNVTLSCQNLKTTVSWEYSKQQPPTYFSVRIGSSAGPYENETADHRYDLSHFVWKTEEHYMGFHYVNVTAIQGSTKSLPVQSKSLTFNNLKTAHIKCALDFPPAKLTSEDSGTTVSFQNPLHFYKELKQANKLHKVFFEFNVSSDDRHFESVCSSEQIICKEVISFPEGVEECVTLKGWLGGEKSADRVVFRETGLICLSKSEEGNAEVTLTILLCVVILVICLITAAICKVRAWTMKLQSPPKALDLELSNHGERHLRYNTVATTPISVVRLIKANGSTENLQDSGLCSVLQHLTKSLYATGGLSEESSQRLKAVGLMSEGHGTDDDSADDSLKTECVSMDEAEEETEPVSNYDRPHILQADIGDGDMVEVYTKR